MRPALTAALCVGAVVVLGAAALYGLGWPMLQRYVRLRRVIRGAGFHEPAETLKEPLLNSLRTLAENADTVLSELSAAFPGPTAPWPAPHGFGDAVPLLLLGERSSRYGHAFARTLDYVARLGQVRSAVLVRSPAGTSTTHRDWMPVAGVSLRAELCLRAVGVCALTVDNETRVRRAGEWLLVDGTFPRRERNGGPCIVLAVELRRPARILSATTGVDEPMEACPRMLRLMEAF
jgi:hypothetical protein